MKFGGHSHSLRQLFLLTGTGARLTIEYLSMTAAGVLLMAGAAPRSDSATTFDYVTVAQVGRRFNASSNNNIVHVLCSWTRLRAACHQLLVSLEAPLLALL
jgi:hypothetical protein